jgi:integrase
LALFSTAIDTMLHGQDLLSLVVGDVEGRDGSIRPVIEVARARGMPPVRCALSRASTKALKKWITASGKKRTDYLFPFRGVEGRRHPMGARQLSRLLKLWVVEAGLDPRDYSLESLRRTKALHILKGTGDLQTVRALLGHAQIESTATTQSRSVAPSISNAIGADRQGTACTSGHLCVREACRDKSAYPPRLSVIADIPARQLGAQFQT